MDSDDLGPSSKFVQKLSFSRSPMAIFGIVLGLALIAGVGSGYILASTASNGSASPVSIVNKTPANAQQDNQTFRDFAEGTIQNKPTPKNGQDYSEGTHQLVRQGQQPVALTSSVVDLSKYVGKKVKVYGETQKALKQGWLMDVGKVEEQK